MSKFTKDLDLMHEFVGTGTDDIGRSLVRCKHCGTYWLTVLRHYNYNDYPALREVCPAIDPNRETYRLPSGEEIAAQIRERQRSVAAET
jgi:uncharacterized Zn finger protein